MSRIEELQSKVATANNSQLLEIIYESMLININEAKKAMVLNDLNTVKEKNNSVREALAHLMSTLEGADEEALKLKSLYLYINELITNAEFKNNTDFYETAIKVITPIKEAWKSLGEKEALTSNNKPSIRAGATYGKNDINEYVTRTSKDWDMG
ncbi:MAG: flagellar protein FliS [Peptostreptococcaceae bacterium]|jgi:flagellar protein FliS|nr:flagellar protein FliS [Peptostreptococcaceae bacterium]